MISGARPGEGVWLDVLKRARFTGDMERPRGSGDSPWKIGTGGGGIPLNPGPGATVPTPIEGTPTEDISEGRSE